MSHETLITNLSHFIHYLEIRKPALLQHPDFIQYVNDFEAYIHMPGAESRVNFRPCLDDKTAETPLDKYYFYQDTWAARKIFELAPAKVVDIGSTALLVGIISQFVPTISIDVRPLPVFLDGLTCQKGSITELPFEDNSVEYLTTLCVIEHIGLGRYGDALDSLGSIKAFKEIGRVVKPGGHLLFSVPLSQKPGLSFNAHRIFSKTQILDYLHLFSLREEIHLFPEPGNEKQMERLQDFQFCVWCAHMKKKEVPER
jgi:SAM-dependent methyltransferase